MHKAFNDSAQRIHVTLTTQTRKELDEIMTIIDSQMDSETVRRAVHVYYMLLTTPGKVIIHAPEGYKEVVFL
jgi:hypothetical protein